MNKNLYKAIENIKKKVENVPKMVEQSCHEIAVRAQSNAPYGITVSSNGNVIRAEGPLGDTEFAAHMEFGTGKSAATYIPSHLPQEWDEYAYTFYVTGKGTRKASPYLFPAFEAERVELIKKIKESFKNG